MAVKRMNEKVINKDDSYSEFNRVAYKTAYSIIRQREQSEDIAQLVTMRYLLNENKINPESARNWIITASKNESFSILKKDGREVYRQPETFQEYEEQITESLFEDETKQLEMGLLLRELNRRFPEEERVILERYFLEGKKLSKLFPLKGKAVKKSTLYQQIYRLRKDIRAEYNQIRGMKASKDIVSSSLNQSIIRFIKKYKACIEKRSFSSMTKYLKDIGIPDSIPRINIKEIIDYDIEMKGRNEYEITVCYIDNRNLADSFTTVFTFNDKKNLTIKKIPDNNKKQVITIDTMLLPKEFMENISKTDSEGYVLSNKEEIMSIIQSLDESAYQIRDIKKQKRINLKND